MAVRRRSEVVGSQVAPLQGQQSIPGAAAPPLERVTCKSCGLTQSRRGVVENGGKCIRLKLPDGSGPCGADPDAEPQRATDPAAQAAMKKEDPAGLTPESVQHQVDPAARRPAELSMADLHHALTMGNGRFSFPLTDVAQWSVEERQATTRWIASMYQEEMPAFLARYLGKPPSTESKLHDVSVAKGNAGAAQKSKVANSKVDVPRETSKSAKLGEHTGLAVVTEDDWVEYTFGEEKFFPVASDRYSNCVVGPFRARTRVRPDETHGEALLRLFDEVQAVAETARRAKLKSFQAQVERGVS
jgi:hypothetical protein